MEDAINGMLPPESADLRPLPPVLRSGLTGVTVVACFSLFSSTVLFCHLTYKIVTWKRKTAAASASSTVGVRGSNDYREPPSPGVDLALGLAERHFHRDYNEEQEDTSAHSSQWGARTKRWIGRGDGRTKGRTQKKEKPELNQFLVLLYNLLLADMHQAMAFILNAVWIGNDAIIVGSSTCWAQGLFVSNGDLSASLFIAAIAIHTYSIISRGYKPPQWVINATCIGIWVFTYAMVFIGLAVTRNGERGGGFYVRAAAWCWINQRFETLRLVTHYLFIFITLALTSILYTLVFFSLRRRQKCQQQRHQQQMKLTQGQQGHELSTLPSNKSSIDIRRAAIKAKTLSSAISVDETPDLENNDPAIAETIRHPGFLIYPVIYVVCTLPLALGRIATMAGADVPLSYFCAAGALITSNGWLDVLLWSSTRRSLVFGDVGEEELGLATFSFVRTPPNRRFGNIVWVEGGADNKSKHASKHSSGSSSSHTGTKNNSRSGSPTRRRDNTNGLFSRVRVGGGDTLRSVRDRVLRGPRGWRELGGRRGRAGSGTRPAGSISQESLHHRGNEQDDASVSNWGRGSGGLAIQMDLETSVVVEIEDQPQGLPRSREPSTSLPKYDEKDMPDLPPIL